VSVKGVLPAAQRRIVTFVARLSFQTALGLVCFVKDYRSCTITESRSISKRVLAIRASRPADQQAAEFLILLRRAWSQFDEAGAPISDVAKRSVEAGPAFGLDLSPEALMNLALGSRAEFKRDPLRRPLPKPFADIVSADDKVPSVIRSTSHEDMDVRVVRIPVIDRNPFQLRPEVALGVVHEFTGEGAKVRHLCGVFGRDNEPEMMPVFRAALGERSPIRVVRGRVEKARVLAIAGHAFALEIGDVPGERRCDELAATMAHDAGHDDDAPGRRPGG
jgi:hypothetical protein